MANFKLKKVEKSCKKTVRGRFLYTYIFDLYFKIINIDLCIYICIWTNGEIRLRGLLIKYDVENTFNNSMTRYQVFRK